MTGLAGLVAVLLVGAATVVAWPVRAVRARRREVLGARPRSGAAPVAVRTPGGTPVGCRVPVPHGRGSAPATLDRPLPARPPNRRDSAHPSAALRLDVESGSAVAARSLRPSLDASAPTGPADPWPDGAAAMSPLDDLSDVGTPSPTRGRASRSATTPGVNGPPVDAARIAPFADPAPGLPGTVPRGGRRAAGGRGRQGRGSVDRRALARAANLPPRHALLAAIVLGGGAGAVLGGPVGGVVLAAYGALGARAVRRRHARRSADQARRRELDQLCTLAADLRAGLPVTLALVDGPDRVARLARAAVRLADRTGAPLAELLERVEADARASDRGLAAASAQAAGARATAWLLAALPLGGIGLGYAIGVDPVAVLLRTAVGGGSALAAVALQIGGLLWAERLGAAPGRAD